MEAALVPLLNVMKAFGMDPASLLAGIIVAIIITYGLPPVLSAVRALKDKIIASPSKVDDAALPILEAIEAKLDIVKEDDRGLKTVAYLVASGVVDAAVNKKDAKRIASKVMAELDAEIVKLIKDMPTEVRDPQ